MSGHSKWNNIKHKKEKTDAQKAKVFTKIGKEIAIAVKEGGPDPVSNGKLRDVIAKAKASNVPNDNIERIIKKSSAEDVNYEEITYEGYGPSGVAVIVEATTDNRNRTGSEMRHYFDKYGGNLGQTGCVSFMFSDEGVIVIEKDDDIEEEKIMEDALECGASDFESADEAYIIKTESTDLSSVNEELIALGYKPISAQVEKVPSSYVKLEDEDDIKKMTTLLDMLDENDDVSEVYHNWENED